MTRIIVNASRCGKPKRDKASLTAIRQEWTSKFPFRIERGLAQEMDAALAFVAHELALFAAVGFLLFGADDLLVDLIWIARTAWRRVAVYTLHARADVQSLAGPVAPGRIAIFVPAWDEADVIGPMLANTLARLQHPDFRIFVGCYPNDPATLKVVDVFAAGDARVRVVVTPRPGPTTKADCLNALYRAMVGDEHSGIM